MKRALLAAALLVCALAPIALPAEAGAVYSATFSNQSGYPDPLEPGDTATLWFEFHNTGDQTWFREGAVPVRLGTSSPRESANPFFDSGDWVTSTRPTGLDQASVPPGAVGRFTFRVKAPSTPMTNQPYAFAPLAESVVWMIPDGTLVWMAFTVIPAQHPVVRITSAPARVKRGDTFVVAADATDNRRIAKLTFTVGSSTTELTAPTTAPSVFSVTLPSAAMADGTHSVTVRATDPGGRESVATTSFEVFTPAPAASGGTPQATAPTGAAKPSPALRSFKVAFGTIARRKPRPGGAIGRLHSLADMIGVPRGSRVEIRCVRACRSRLRKTITWRGRPSLIRHTVTRATIVRVRVTTPAGASRAQRYRFTRGRFGLLYRKLG